MDNGTPPENNERIATSDSNSVSHTSNLIKYAITVTFKKLICKSPFGQFKETAPYLTKLLNSSCNFKLYPEWRHSTGDIHYHGIIEIKDYVKWFKQTLPSLKCQGFVLIKKIDNMEKWEQYLNKESYIAKGILPLHLTLPIDRVVQIVKTKAKKNLVVMPIIETIEREISDSE